MRERESKKSLNNSLRTEYHLNRNLKEKFLIKKIVNFVTGHHEAEKIFKLKPKKCSFGHCTNKK